MNSSLLKFQKISKSFGNLKALDNVSIDIPSSSIFGILGPNGSGKSTLMRILAGLIKSWDGEISLLGNNYSSNSKTNIHEFGFLIEDPSFYEYLTAYQNLEIFSRLTNTSKEKIKSVLELVNLSERSNNKVKTYSYGMKQRLGLAQCLLHDPKILILDEPNNGLDPSGIREMSKIISTLHNNNKTICISTHILSEVDSLCTHAAVLKKGKHISTIELDDAYHSKSSYLIQTEDTSICKQVFEKNDDLNHQILDSENFLVTTSKPNAITMINKLISEKMRIFNISKQSNLMEFFND